MILEAMCQDLARMPEEVWAAYALSRDPLRGKFTAESYAPYYARACACGAAEAAELRREYGDISGRELAEEWGIAIQERPLPVSGGMVTFALFDESGIIVLDSDNAAATTDLLRSAKLSEPLGETDILEMLLSHELFHALQRRKPELYVNQPQLTLWKIFGYAHRSCIPSLEEVASMAFARERLHMRYNPYVYDALMLLPQFPEQAYALYQTLKTLQKEAAV